MLSYCKITMPHMVCRNLIPAIAFFDWPFLAGFTVLGIDYFFGDSINHYLDKDSVKEGLAVKEGFDIAAWVAKSTQRAKEALPNWLKEVRETYGGLYH